MAVKDTQWVLARKPTGKRHIVQAYTASATLNPSMSGRVCTNLGATGNITLTLPTLPAAKATKGVTYTFTVQAAYSIAINPGASGAIYWGGVKLADDADITLSTIGNRLTVTSDGSGDWIVTDSDLGAPFEVSATPAAYTDRVIYVANRAVRVIGFSLAYSTAEATAANLRVQLTKDTGTNAPGAGTDLLTDNSGAGVSLKATANTTYSGTITGTAATSALAAGNRLSLDFEAAATELAGLTVTVMLLPI